ncbi:unnamed protein product [Rhizoctonia solani]|uniref:Fungal-specific transcription factor domain protein n=1 Tax=Rhizoctonia solani TaxID=456999 RepID=A0A8H3GY11_9AGAM|nr:unnamed protein product [Rhizoctonia solani]
MYSEATITADDINFLENSNVVGDLTLPGLSNPWTDPTSSPTNQTPTYDAPINRTPTYDAPVSDLAHAALSLSMTPGQASLFQDLFSLGYPQDSAFHGSSSFSNGFSDPSTWLSQTETDAKDEDDDPEGAISIISHMPALDPNAESNTLPFILHNYAAWVTRKSFEPLKLTHISRDFVFAHYGASLESRWILVLLANVGGIIGRAGGLDQVYMPLLSALHNSVLQRIASVAGDDESIQVVDLALEAISVHFFVSPIPEAEALRRAVASVFRRLGHGPVVNLSSLKNYSFCLEHYAHIDILLGGLTDFPMTFRYDTTFLSPPWTEPSAHWIFGIPDHLIALFARMNMMREDRSIPIPTLVSELEREICAFRPVQSESTRSFLCVVRMMIQECWRQVAYIYLYMAVCGESSEGYRVKCAMKQLMDLVNGTTPGRFPDEFLAATYMMAAPAARLHADRQTLINRIVGPCGKNRESGIGDNLKMIQDYWARADAEARPIVWSDVIVSRIRVVGM